MSTIRLVTSGMGLMVVHRSPRLDVEVVLDEPWQVDLDGVLGKALGTGQDHHSVVEPQGAALGPTPVADRLEEWTHARLEAWRHGGVDG